MLIFVIHPLVFGELDRVVYPRFPNRACQESCPAGYYEIIPTIDVMNTMMWRREVGILFEYFQNHHISQQYSHRVDIHNIAAAAVSTLVGGEYLFSSAEIRLDERLARTLQKYLQQCLARINEITNICISIIYE